MFEWRINGLEFSGGEVVTMEPGSVLLLIGPNSSGKSEGLRNIQGVLQGGAPVNKVVKNVSVHRAGSMDDLSNWLDKSYPKRNLGGQPHYVTRGWQIDVQQAAHMWTQGDYLPGIWPLLSSSLDTASRTTLANYTGAINIWETAPQHYIHMLQTDPVLQETVNREIRASFGRELVIDWAAITTVGFRVGQEPERTAKDDRVSEAYHAALAKMPRLDEDGDGIRSFAGCVLATYCGAHPVLLIDEPEAFLHPPQARRLGAAFANAAKERNRQVVIATHSADVVQGALNADGRVAVCRLTRSGDLNHAAVLDATQLKNLWAKPLLRSAAAINGLFHAGAVVCEADADVRLYEAVMRRAEVKGRLATTDLFFTQGGGKGELPTLAQAYGSLKTRTAVIADIDLVRNAVEHHKVLAALGSELNTRDPRYKSVMSALGDAPPLMTPEAGAAEIRATVDDFLSEGEVARRHKERIGRALQESAKFSEAKRYGIAKLRGEPLQFAKELLAEWRAVGLFILPVGELESWWPEGPASSKADWIAEVIELLADPDSLPDLEDFVCDVASFFASDDETEPTTSS